MLYKRRGVTSFYAVQKLRLCISGRPDDAFHLVTASYLQAVPPFLFNFKIE